METIMQASYSGTPDIPLIPYCANAFRMYCMSSSKNVYLHFTDWSDVNTVYVTSRKGAEIKGIQTYNVACFCKHSMIFITQI